MAGEQVSSSLDRIADNVNDVIDDHVPRTVSNLLDRSACR
jgi:hypothetical protein